MKNFSFSIIAIALLTLASNLAIAQSGIITQILNPPRNYEIALGDTLTPSARIINDGSVPITGLKIYYHIQNPITGFIPYFDSIIVPTITPGDTIDLLASIRPCNLQAGMHLECMEPAVALLR